MTDLCYIAMAKLHGSWTIISASSDEDEAKLDADEFERQGYRTKVEKTFIHLDSKAVARIWRIHQKVLENKEMQ